MQLWLLEPRPKVKKTCGRGFHCLETQCGDCGQPRNLRKAESPAPSIPTLLRHRFLAFWLWSKCSICSYQLNIWYEDHVSSSILIWFLPGETRSVACNAGFTSRPCIAVPQGLAHFPINLYNWVFSIKKFKEVFERSQCETLKSLENKNSSKWEVPP